MKDALGYEGKTVVMTGAASGMGAAAAHLLVDLGAEVHALDIGEVTAPVHRFIKTDMKSQSSDSSLLGAGQHSHDQRGSFSRFIEETGQWIFHV